MPAEKEPPDVPEMVDLASSESVAYWCERWEVTEAELRAGVEKAGTTKAAAVAFALDREAW